MLKGLILCGGRGSRLRPLTFSRPKHLLPLMNKPVLFYGIEAIVDAGIRDIAIVVPPGYRKVFDESLQGGEPWNVSVSLIEQPEPKGLADAVRVARSFINQDDFLLYLGDNVIDGPLLPLIHQFQSEGLDGLVSVSYVEKPEQFGVVQLDGNKLMKVVEKPKNPPSHLAINGVYLFQPYVFEAIDRIVPSARGEYELTDAIQRMIDDSRELGVFRSPYWWKDTGQPNDLLYCNRHFMQGMQGIHIQGELDTNSSVTGPVMIGEHTKIVNSTIRGPVIIGRNAVIENAYIGPFAAVSDQASIRNCELENSIVMEHALLDAVPYRIDESLIGGEVKMIGKPKQPRAVQLWVGDHSHLLFPR